MAINRGKIIYWIATIIMCLVFLYSASMYFMKYEMVEGFFKHLGFPTWLIYPMAVAKVLGVIAVLTKKSNLLKEWAYAGFFFDATLAFFAHKMADDGGGMIAAVAFVSVVISRIFESQTS